MCGMFCYVQTLPPIVCLRYVLYIGTLVLLFRVPNPPSLPYNFLSFKFEFKTCLFSDDSRFFFFCKLSFRFSIIISSSVLVHTVERLSNGFHFWVYVILKVFSFPYCICNLTIVIEQLHQELSVHKISFLKNCDIK